MSGFSDEVCDWLVEEGYTHCFFLAGGNIMHLLESARSRFTCVPFVHEVACGIAAEYFNEVSPTGNSRAFVLVTAGPGVTNLVTSIAGSFFESRELLVLAGQVKSSDLSQGQVRQRGVQEIDGVELTRSITKLSFCIDQPVSKAKFLSMIHLASSGRPGPVFLEVCLDAQRAPGLAPEMEAVEPAYEPTVKPFDGPLSAVKLIAKSERPVLLIGGGVSRESAKLVVKLASEIGLPCATTWNGADRISSDHPLYAGRPNTWGMRWANIVLQQADLVIAAGTRLGLQQTGFNWEQFMPVGKVVQIDLDESELTKGHPRVDLPILGDVNQLLPEILELASEPRFQAKNMDRRDEWLDFIGEVRRLLPLQDPSNSNSELFIDPYVLVGALSVELADEDVVIPCSSGGALTVTMQALELRETQTAVTNKGLASMGYGLAGAIGAAFALPQNRVVLIDGDGGFIQNMQELGTLAANSLNVKVILFSNEGYASIRMTQQNYFGGTYIGCDVSTGLGLPDWRLLCASFGIPHTTLDPARCLQKQLREAMESDGPCVVVVPVDPQQTYYPKISSSIAADGTMSSSPLHQMTPPLGVELSRQVFRFLKSKQETPVE